MDKTKCAGVKLSGYWRGYPCHSVPVDFVKGKPYCALHCYTAANEPERFEKARAAGLKREAKRLADS